MKKLVDLLRDQRFFNMTVNGPGKDAWGDQQDPPKEPTIAGLFLNILRSIFLFWESLNPPRTRKDLVVPRLRDPDDGLTRWIRAEWTPFRLALRNPEEWTRLWAAIRNLCSIKKKEKDQPPLPSSEKPKPPAEKKDPFAEMVSKN